jgi:hypothetical protein
MIPFQFLMLTVGTTFIRFLHGIRRRLFWQKYFSFSDLLVEEQQVTARGFLEMAVPPFLGGFVMALFPAVHPITVSAAGFLAAFLGVWPVFQFPYQLLDEYLLPYWGKLKFLYALFLGFSTSLAYLGFLLSRAAVPLVQTMTGTNAWQKFLDDLAANAIYDAVKGVTLALFFASGLYLSRQRKRIGTEIGKKRDAELKAEEDGLESRQSNEGV